MIETFRDLLREWIAKEIVIVNPESLLRSGSGDAVGFETYSARVRAVGNDFVQVAFQAQHGGRVETVEQFIPTDRVKRLSLWGGELYLHL